MKPSPQEDFPITVRRECFDHLSEVAHFYVGIYQVILNFTVTVTFMPEISLTPQPPPMDPDRVSSMREARWAALVTADCAVTASDRLAGTVARIAWPVTQGDQDVDFGTVIFYVSRMDFETYSVELDELVDQFGGLRDSKLCTELMHYRAVATVLPRVVESEFLSDYQKELLCRGRIFARP